MENVPPSHLDQPSTHASRNPQKKIIAPQKNYVKKSVAKKASAEVQKAMKKERKALLQSDIDSFTKHRDNLANELAEKYNVKVDKARQMLSNALVIKQKRHINVWNVLVSWHGRELNEGRSKGDRLPLAEIQDIIQKELDEGMHEDINKNELLEELEDIHKVKMQGARSSNKAATLDYEAALG